MGAKATVPNPSRPRALRPVELITDRAKRYRAQQQVTTSGEHCGYCGAPKPPRRPLDVDHIDGDEANSNPQNLTHACRACNTSKGIHYARAGHGTRTRQFNPAKKKRGKGSASRKRFEAYVTDMRIARGYIDGDQAAAWKRIADNYTPHERSAFTSRMWDYRRKIGATRTGRQMSLSDMPDWAK